MEGDADPAALPDIVSESSETAATIGTTEEPPESTEERKNEVEQTPDDRDDKSAVETDVELEPAETDVSASGELMRELETFFGGKDEEEEANSSALASRVEQLERERGQLTAEVLEKDEGLSKLEREVSSLKGELEQKEEEHRRG